MKNSQRLMIVLVLLALVSQGFGKEVPSFEEFSVITNRNIFRKEHKEEKAASESIALPATASVDIEVVGIIKTRSRYSMAVINDRGRQRICRVGDIIGGGVITEIRTHEVCFDTGDETKITKIRTGMTVSHHVTPEVRKPTSEPLLPRLSLFSGSSRRVPVKNINNLPQFLPLTAHLENEKVKGLRLTQDLMGLKEGDLITKVGVQSLTTNSSKQKFFQMTQKYRQSCRKIPEIPIVVEREGKKFEIVLVPTS